MVQALRGSLFITVFPQFIKKMYPPWFQNFVANLSVNSSPCTYPFSFLSSSHPKCLAQCRIDTEKLAKLQSQARIGGKGTVRRKVKKSHKTAAGEQVKLTNALKKINAQNIPAIEEVNMFKEDGQVIHFAAPKGIT